MNSPGPKKLQVVDLLPNRMKHPGKPKKLGLQLAIPLGLNVLTIQPNFLARGIAPRFNLFFVSLFLKVLGMIEVLITHNYQLSKFY